MTSVMWAKRAAIASMIIGSTEVVRSLAPAAMKPATSRGMLQPARSRAVAMWLHRRAGSLSATSRETHATVAGRDPEANHWATSVLLP